MPQTNPTKFQQFLKSLGLSQTDLYNLTAAKYPKPIGMDRISKFANGGDVMLSTILKICWTLDCTLDDIIDPEQYAEMIEE